MARLVVTRRRRVSPLPLPLPLPLLLLLGAAACGTDVSGPPATLVSCVFADPTRLEPGGVLQVRGEGHRDVCLTPGDEGAGLFLYVPFYASPAPSGDTPAPRLQLDIRTAGTTAVTGSALPAPAREPVLLGAERVPGWRPIDQGFDTRLRLREIRELQPLIHTAGTAPAAPGGSATGPVAATPSLADPPHTGDLVDYNVAISCTNENVRTGRVGYISQHAIVVADTGNPVALSQADLASIAATFDTLVYPVDTENFGESTDIDGNGRAIIFFTRAVNQLNAHQSGSVTVGFFWSGDLFPAESTTRLEACSGGNRAEMFYMIAPDPDGAYGPSISTDEVLRRSVGIIAHEYQHLINAGRRLYVNEATVFEEPWLNEGLSHTAEELVFYHVTGLHAGMNLTADALRSTTGGVEAFNRFVAPDFDLLRSYLEDPDTTSLMGVPGLSTRGAVWAFLRYAADRSGRTDAVFFRDLVNSTTSGLDNVSAALGASALAWMQDWTVAVFADDAVPGVDARFTQPSWDYRDVFTNSTVGEYPLSTRTLSPEGDHTFSLLPGGAAFPLFQVSGGERATLHAQSGDRAPPDALRGSFLRVH